MTTFDENKNERKAQDIRYSFFVYTLKNDFDKLIEENINSKINEIQNLKSLNVDIEKEFDKIVQEVLLAEKVKILCEMKIVYAYKSFEISLKHFLSYIYPTFKKTEAYKKNYIEDFLKSEGIKYNEIKNCHEIDQIRRVNNGIKHSNILDTQDIEEIPEFCDKSFIQYEEILNFYERTSTKIGDFFNDLRLQVLLSNKDKSSQLIY